MNTGASEIVQQVMACCTTLTSEVQVQSSQKRGGENSTDLSLEVHLVHMAHMCPQH